MTKGLRGLMTNKKNISNEFTISFRFCYIRCIEKHTTKALAIDCLRSSGSRADASLS